MIDTIFVENAARAHVLALQELQGKARCSGKPYFITNNEPLPQGEIIQKLLAAIGIMVKIRSVPTGIARAVGTVCEFSWRYLYPWPVNPRSHVSPWINWAQLTGSIPAPRSGISAIARRFP